MQWPIADMSWIVPYCFRYKFDDIRGLLRIIRFWSPSLNSSYGAQPWSWSNTSNNQLCFFITTDKFDGGWIFLSRHYSPSRYHDKKYQLMKDFIVVLVRFSRTRAWSKLGTQALKNRSVLQVYFIILIHFPKIHVSSSAANFISFIVSFFGSKCFSGPTLSRSHLNSYTLL